MSDSYGRLVFGFTLDSDECEEPIFMQDEDNDGISFSELMTKDLNMPNEDEKGISQDEHIKRMQARWKAEETYATTLVSYNHYSCPMCILSIPGHSYSGGDGGVEIIDPTKLVVAQEKIDAMKAWCEKFKVKWKKPEWLLCCDEG